LVASSFFTAAGSDELVAARRMAIGVAQRTVDDARVRLSAGVVNRVEVTRAELALIQARQRLLESEDSRAASYRALATLLRLPAGSFRVVPPPEPTDEFNSDDQLIDQALHQRPDLLGSQLQLRAIGKQISGQWLRYAPSVSLFGNIRLTNTTGFGGRNDYYAAGAQLDWMLFDGLARDAQRHSFEAQKREQLIRLDSLRDNITDEVVNARRSVNTRRQGLLAAQRSVQMAQETLDLVRAQYEAGTAKQLDLLIAQDQLTTAQVGLAQARFDLALAVLNVRKVTGGSLAGS
jgi:outer membrane protein TolC